MRFPWQLMAGIVLRLWLATGIAPHAFAHASLISSEPADGAQLAGWPKQFVLRFNEPVSPLVLKLTVPDGSSASLLGVAWKGGALAVPAPNHLGKGTYAFTWRVTSQDGHPVGGTIVFSVGERSTGNIRAQSSEAPGLKPLIWFLRAGLYLTLFFGVGAAAFRAWAMDGDSLSPFFARMISFTLALVFPVAILSLGVLGIDALNASWRGLLIGPVWQAALSTSYAVTVVGACLASLAALISIYATGTRLVRLSSIAALALVGVAIAASGHAATAAPQTLSRLAVFAHVVCITIWAGTLLGLAWLYATAHSRRGAVLRRFSAWIVWPVAILMLSGAVIALLQLKPLTSLFTTSYGHVLLIKLSLVACLLALAGYNRYWLTAPAVAREPWTERRLLQSIGTELVLFSAILGIVALWRFTPPPRSFANSPAEITLHIHSQQVMARVHVMPGRVGSNRMTIDLTGAPAKAVRVSIENQAAQIEHIRREAVRDDDGTWTIQELPIPIAGQWTLRLDVLVSDFDSVTLEGSLGVPP